MDKRKFHLFLKGMKDMVPQSASFLESIQDEFENRIEPISNSERIALISLPEQFIERVPLEHPEWTTKLHVWAENCVPELLRINPIYLTHENSFGDSVIMCLIKSACGAYTDNVNYPFIRQILNTNMSYEDTTVDQNTGMDIINNINILNTPDISGKSAIDYLIDFAYGIDTFEGTEPDDVLKEMLIRYSEGQ
jgi:hypothetical protein